MGPLWRHPLKHGAALVLYSATKYIDDHSDVIVAVAFTLWIDKENRTVEKANLAEIFNLAWENIVEV